MLKKIDKNQKRKERHYSIRNKVVGTPERPRLNIFKSSKHIYAQVIDDATGVTLASASTLDKELVGQVAELTKTDAAKLVGKTVGERAKDKGINAVVFDRGGYLYHGRVKLLADGARESGLEF
ncbi:50S ribosomal protein L18 [Sedimentibacter hydroxybenzoicus DSM 7310]|uniref:Large ribosomal subunit protein uL18 n=1 Tax=Sedimentibacter hydroxybenzoicus DSM 7310 TaxID=1123245 RepID=A0A974BK40_SEDHY|nr:50S ribosomal protein L18 [Sedimentibacter hydroxybenzoicus]NYB74222.1 50S ribosomal protein L18 [Sedimentibacter hydroxybenzoicus DSM 7310]